MLSKDKWVGENKKKKDEGNIQNGRAGHTEQDCKQKVGSREDSNKPSLTEEEHTSWGVTYLVSLQVTSVCCEKAPTPPPGTTYPELQSKSLLWLFTDSVFRHTRTYN